MAYKLETVMGQKEEFIDRKPEIINNEDYVAKFIANGNELYSLKMMFANIPFGNKNICIWRGEMAQFLYDNLIL